MITTMNLLLGGESVKQEYEKPELVEYEDLQSLTGGDDPSGFLPK